MIDLSYLTEEEQEMIRTVLKRDNELKKKEEQRIKKLQKTEGDKRKLKYLTGEWFYETKSNRHRDRIHGSDIIRASMRHSQPVTILELSEICPEKPSFLNSKSKDVFIPPELCGILEDFPSCDKREDHYQLAETQQNTCSPTAQPQIKPRLNPFNSKLLSAGSPKKTSGAEETHLVPATLNQTPKDTLLITASQQQQPAAGPHTTPTKLDQTSASESGQTPAQELPPSAVPLNTSQNTDSPKSTPSATRQLAKKKLLLYFSHDSVLNTTSDPVSRQDMSPSPRGILKHSSSSGSFTDSLSLRNSCSSQPTSPLSPESSDNSHSPPLSPSSDLSSSGCLDRKQVRFSPIVQARDTGSLEAQDTKEHDHHGNHAEPHSLQVPKPYSTPVEKGGSVEPSPVRAVLKQANVRPISISKSLENLASLPSREERRKIESRSDITVSVEDVSAGLHVPGPSVSDPEQMKMLSVSVPAFIQQQRSGRESDSTSVNSFYSERQRKDSTYTNLSSSSDLAPYSVSGSVMSIYGTDFGNVEVKGTIQFAINYVQKLAEFHIFIVQCRDLAVAEPKRNRSDPYVKCYLLPDKEKLGKRKTSVKKKTLNPTYNEILRFKITLDNLKSHTLNLSVWHNDTFGKNSFLGEVDVDLSEWDFSNSHMMDYALKGRVPVQSSPKHVSQTLELSGEMRVALRFLTQTTQSKKTPQNGEVQIWVKECKNLPARRGTIDPFIKCAVLPDTARKGRQKTRVVKRTANPVFNHTMVYDGLRPEDLREACVELTVWDHDRLSNHFIGGLRLGLGTGKSYGSEVDWMDSNTAEAGLWKRMTESQNEWVEDVIPLRMLIMARTVSK
ncbi:synaptotagmin-like protein 2 isoform X10 [Astyanax mexicanus]|uniref:synaptotagmin-like protein 2 isoform X10 n=1 Tax=Astyanax mexicanus TaxID=7994 RepID=UPI0020CAE8C3|nr:synaptotagmin-like protein 2 isoform X10 [Astyanax mexicanus]